MKNVINRQITALGAAVLAAALVVPTLGRDAPGRPPAAAITAPATSPANLRRPHMHNAGGRPRTFGADRFTEDKVKEVLAFAKKHLPEEYKRFETLRKENPRQARRAIRRLWWLYKRVRHLPPEIQAAAVAKHRLNVAIFQTRRDFLRTEDASRKAELTKKLQTLLGKQFDNDQIVKEYRIKVLAQQLAELKAEVGRRKKDRSKIIAERLKRLLSSAPATRSGA